MKHRQDRPAQETARPDALDTGAACQPNPCAPSPRVVVAACAGLLAAWIAAGSTGLLVRPLQHALAWVGIGVVLGTGWPRRSLGLPEWGALAGAAVAAAILTVPAVSVYNVAAVCFVMAALGWTARDADRKALVVAACAVAVLAIYRLANATIPGVWLACDAIGQAIGRGAGALCGRPLWIGSSFAGLDFLVLMGALGAGWLHQTAPPRSLRAGYAGAAILGAHLLYLVVLAYGHDLLAMIPKRPPVEPAAYQSDLYVPPPWYWGDAVRRLLPWNLPVLAALIHALTAAAMFRWAPWVSSGTSLGGPPEAKSPRNVDGPLEKLSARLALGSVTLAALVPLIVTLSPAKMDLSGRTIVAYEEGYLDWDVPQFDQYGESSAGMYGMLPALVEGLGARLVRVADLASPEIDRADVLLLIHPTEPWSDGQLQRVWDYVRGGGSLLVVAEPRISDEGHSSAFDRLLESTRLTVRFDTALPASPFWQYAMDWAVHPVGAGTDDAFNALGLNESSSIALAWPARPVLTGRWGWSDPGSDAVLTGVHRLEPGERLGDLVLAAEQRVGSGRVVVVGDAGALRNLGLANSYEYVGRLLGYLASRSSSPQAGWRQALGVLGALALVVLLGWHVEAGRLAAAMAILVLSLACSTVLTAASTEILPEAPRPSARPVACIDASHAEAFSYEPWAEDGLEGLQLTLMRNGYLPIVMRHWSEEQLKRAAMLISIAPAHTFSSAQRAAVRRFLGEGGVMLCTAGANQAGPIRPLLAEFGLDVPLSPLAPGDSQAEPKPMGYFRTRYLDTGKYSLHVGLYAGWPVECVGDKAEPLVRGFDDQPVVASARVGNGQLLVVGDTYFAANKNLEGRDGEASGRFVENAQFWRWLLARLRGQEWIPPEPPEEEEDAAEEMPAEARPAADRGALRSGPARAPAGKEASP